MRDVKNNGGHLKMKKLIILSLIGIGVYLVLSKRKVYAEELPEIPAEIPSTPQAPDNPAISMADQLLKEIQEERIAFQEQMVQYEVVTPSPQPSEICEEIEVPSLPFFQRIRGALMLAPIPKKKVYVCGSTRAEREKKAMEQIGPPILMIV